MQVLGGLVKLPRYKALPVPWYHRAPLGLLDNTRVYVALVEDTSAPKNLKRPIGDLMVSVVHPDKWHRLVRVQARREDKAGVISDFLGLIPPSLNIALAEAATVTGNTHQVTLICEPFSDDNLTSEQLDEIAKSLKKGHFTGTPPSRPFGESMTIKWFEPRFVKHGWVADCDWLAAIHETYSDQMTNKIDLSRAVISADTTLRLVRYIFPLKGARTVKIRHEDAPGALKVLIKSLVDCDVNVLSALLRRGGEDSGSAKLIAVCEPNSSTAAKRLTAAIQDKMKTINWKYRPKVEFSDGKPAQLTIYPRHPDDVVARVPPALKPKVLEDRESFPKGKFRVFFSRRFFQDNSRADNIAQQVRKILEKRGCVVVEAAPEVGGTTPPFFQVASKMWISDAGIVLVAGPGRDGEDAFSVNLSHEYGFLQGQGKDILLLIERGHEGIILKWMNAYAPNYCSFSVDRGALMDPEAQANIDKWISRVTVEVPAIGDLPSQAEDEDLGEETGGLGIS